ncbi:hypothetical protein EDS67_06920 [candidate division KSB1 bacterium]|nr:MAG: hypothetical protein EDS67_06920 [candidate division KSB1 bacterium]MBC6946884.1 hypothetical protein [candidate division KSB1 bacterium]MCE7941320.1 hypothetical protein [Chlorobi bacterium CHB1]MDL1873931.1 hypothetical protein [Cytophagia bacterium CHB2]
MLSQRRDRGFDYQAYTRKSPPDPAKIHRGTKARQQRFNAAVSRLTIRIDDDVLVQFQQLTPQAQGCEKLIDQALREWLSAKGVKELVREELQQSLAGCKVVRTCQTKGR